MADGSDRPGKPTPTQAEEALRNVVLPEVYKIGQADPAAARSLLNSFKSMLETFGSILPTVPSESANASASSPTTADDASAAPDRDGRPRADTQVRLLVALEFLTLAGESKSLQDVWAHVMDNGFPGEPKANVNTQLVRARDKGWLRAPGNGMYAVTDDGIKEFQRLQREFGHLRQRRR